MARSPSRTGISAAKAASKQGESATGQLAVKAGVVDALSKSLAMIEFDMDGTILSANDNFLRSMGYTPDEILGKHHSLFVDNVTRSSAEYQEFWSKLKRGEFHAGQFKRLGKGGREVWLQATYNPIFENGKSAKVIKLAADVTAVVAGQVLAQREQLRLKQMVENATVRILIADRDLKIVYMNPASVRALRQLEQLLPCRVDEILGQSIDIFHKNPEHQRRLLSDPRNLPHRASITLGDEILDLNVSAIRDESGEYIGPMVTWDIITEQVMSKCPMTAQGSKLKRSEIVPLRRDCYGISAEEMASYMQLYLDETSEQLDSLGVGWVNRLIASQRMGGAKRSNSSNEFWTTMSWWTRVGSAIWSRISNAAIRACRTRTRSKLPRPLLEPFCP